MCRCASDRTHKDIKRTDKFYRREEKKKIDKNIKHENIIKTEHKFHQISPEKKKKLKKKGDEC